MFKMEFTVLSLVKGRTGVFTGFVHVHPAKIWLYIVQGAAKLANIFGPISVDFSLQ
jgi:hypothetical protein